MGKNKFLKFFWSFLLVLFSKNFCRKSKELSDLLSQICGIFCTPNSKKLVVRGVTCILVFVCKINMIGWIHTHVQVLKVFLVMTNSIWLRLFFFVLLTQLCSRLIGLPCIPKVLNFLIFFIQLLKGATTDFQLPIFSLSEVITWKESGLLSDWKNLQTKIFLFSVFYSFFGYSEIKVSGTFRRFFNRMIINEKWNGICQWHLNFVSKVWNHLAHYCS